VNGLMARFDGGGRIKRPDRAQMPRRELHRHGSMHCVGDDHDYDHDHKHESGDAVQAFGLALTEKRKFEFQSVFVRHGGCLRWNCVGSPSCR
jgi:hypothetical protein